MRVALLLLIFALSGCISSLTGEQDVAAPVFAITDIDNVTHTQEHDGVLLLDFMGTWCGPCQRGVPDLKDMLAANPDLKILSISDTDSVAKLRDFQVQYEVTWPLAKDPGGVIHSYRQAVGESRAIWPSYAVVEDGRITFFNGGETLPQTLADATGRGAGVQWVIVATAFALALFAPLQPPTHKMLREYDRRAMAMATVAFLLILSLFILEYGLPITGRLRNGAAIANILAIVGLLFWRKRVKEIDTKPNGREIRAGYHLTWYALPAFMVAALAASLTTDQTAWYALSAFALGAGLTVWRMPPAGWSRAFLGYFASAAWLLAMWIR